MKIAAVADLHVKEAEEPTHQALLKEMAKEGDVVVIAGDLTDLGKPKEAEILAADLAMIDKPVVAVLGNHDFECGSVDEISAIFRKAGVHLLDGEMIEIGGVAFVGVKGFVGGFGTRMLGSFGEPSIKAIVAESLGETLKLENAMHQVQSDRCVIILHYAPVPETIAGEPPEIFPFLGSSRLAETIDRFHADAVFHGHAHHGTYEARTPAGIPVYNVAMHIEKPDGRAFALLDV
ncbi:MAG: metallophosphoesterase family protein [Pararhizobium sp.]